VNQSPLILSRSVRALRIAGAQRGPAPLGIRQQGMTGLAGVKTVSAIDIRRAELGIIDIDVAGVRQCAGLPVLFQHIAQYRVVGIADDAVELLPPLTVRPVTRIIVVRVVAGGAAGAIVAGILQQVLAVMVSVVGYSFPACSVVPDADQIR